MNEFHQTQLDVKPLLGAKPSATPSPLSEAASKQVGLHNVGVAPRHRHGHAPVDAVHHLLGGPHTLVSRRLLDDQADESQSLLAQASRGLDSKREEARAHLISQPTVLPVLLSLGLLQHSLSIRSATLYKRGGKRVRNTHNHSGGLTKPSYQQVEALPCRPLLLLAVLCLAFSCRCRVSLHTPTSSPPPASPAPLPV